MLDLGAGTGKLTATVAALGVDVVAVEPDPAMLAELRRELPTVRALPGSAEAIPLPDGSVDAVVAGNAMHWFAMDVAGLGRISSSAAVGPRDRLSTWREQTAGVALAAGFDGPEQAEFPTGSAAPPTPSSPPWRPGPACW